MKQFRIATTADVVDFEVLSAASTKFGVSLTAVALRWIRSTSESAVLVLSRDGFMDWAVSSDKARINGAFFRTKGRVVPLPPNTLAVDDSVSACRTGQRVPLQTWFEHAHLDASAWEMKLLCENYGYTLSLLHLSPGDKTWEPRSWSR